MEDDEDLAREMVGEIFQWEKRQGLRPKSSSVPSNSTPKYILKRSENIVSQKNLHMNVHGSITYNSQNVHQLMNE